MVLCSVVRTLSRFSRAQVTQNCRRALYSTDNKGRYFTKDHEWLTVDAGVGTVGISKYAQDALGEVVFVQLPEVGTTVAAGEECGALESVKAASEIIAPVSGTIVEKNSSVESTPSLINKSCFEEGWLFRVRLSTPEELNQLMDQSAYDKFLEIGRIAPVFADASTIAAAIVQSGYTYDVGEIYYNKYFTPVKYEMTIVPFFNKYKIVAAPNMNAFDDVDEDELESYSEWTFAALLFYALKESAASEQSARMAAMDNATKNADDMIRKLTLLFNRTRQAVITRELIEIISGAAAL